MPVGCHPFGAGGEELITREWRTPTVFICCLSEDLLGGSKICELGHSPHPRSSWFSMHYLFSLSVLFFYTFYFTYVYIYTYICSLTQMTHTSTALSLLCNQVPGFILLSCYPCYLSSTCSFVCSNIKINKKRNLVSISFFIQASLSVQGKC